MADALVIGFGNTLRGDDGIGPAVAEKLARLHFPEVRVIVTHQLTPELAADLAEARFVVFVDASVGGESVGVVRVEPAGAGEVLTHAADPCSVLGLCAAVYGRCPAAWLVTAAGADFGCRDGLSPTGRANAAAAYARVRALIRESTDLTA